MTTIAAHLTQIQTKKRLLVAQGWHETDWVGTPAPPATAADLARLEEHLGLRLPASFRDLIAHNG